MAFQSVPDTWEFLLAGTLPGGKLWNLAMFVNFDVYTQPDATAANAFMLAIHDAYTDNNFDDKLSTAWQLSTLTLTGLNAEGDAQAVSNAHPVTGTDSANPLPNQTAFLINWRTDSRGRSFRGRSFHPGFTEAQSQGNEPVAGVYTAYNAWVADFLGALTDEGAGRRAVVVSRYSGTELKAFPGDQLIRVPKKRDVALTTAITSSDADDRWKTQRRRQLAG